MLLYLLARLSYSCSRLLVDLHACVTTRTRECYYSYSRVLLLVLARVTTRTREVYYSYTRVLLLVHTCVPLASATLHSIGTVPGQLNVQADEESRTVKDRCNWMLSQSIFYQIMTVMGSLEMDLFASRLTRQLPRFYSWRPDLSTDAFMQDWSACRGFANPLWSLIPHCLTKVKVQAARFANNTFMENTTVVSHNPGAIRGLPSKDSTTTGPGVNANGSGVSNAARGTPVNRMACLRESYTVNGECSAGEKFCVLRAWCTNRKTFTPVCRVWALFKYLKRVDSKGDKDIRLPVENGPLSQVISPLIIKEANKAVSDAIKEKGKRNPYLKSVTPEKKAQIAKYAAENGILASIRHFSKDFPDNTLKESSQGLESRISERIG